MALRGASVATAPNVHSFHVGTINGGKL